MMALLPSGSAKGEIELVQIEAAAFSLVIKGKPFHEKYASLQEYIQMDFHDVMHIRVQGTDVEEVKVYDISTQQLTEDLQELRPIFFENGVYQVVISPKGDRELQFYHEHSQLRGAVGQVRIGASYLLLGNLQFQNEVGYSSFEVRMGAETLLEVTLEVFPTKLDYKEDYRKLLTEVNDEIYNLAFHFLKKTYQSAAAQLTGNPSPAEFFRLLSFYFTAFLRALDHIQRQPHHRLEARHEMMRGDLLKRLDHAGRNHLRKNSRLLVEAEHGIQLGNKQYMPVKGMSVKKEVTYDTWENRFVKWMMTRLLSRIDDLLVRLQRRNGRDTQPDRQLQDLVMRMQQQLKAKLQTPFWSNLPKIDRSVSSLVLQLAPGYRDAYQSFLTVSKGLSLQNGLYNMSIKDVATLYEYWTYLKIGSILGKRYKAVSQDVVRVNRDGLHVNLEANRQATRVYKHPVTGETIVLTYQKYAGNLPTIPQRPDTLLSIKKKGQIYPFDYVFDAKYRIDFAAFGTSYGKRYAQPGPLEEDINTMHRYRDSLVAERGGPYERTAFGAYVLFPWNDEQLYEEHHFYRSIDKVNIGGFPFLPNATGLVERFVENLVEKSAEELQREGILPRGSLEAWQASLEEKVLIGVISSLEEYRSALQSRMYRLPASALKRNWQQASYIALYVTQEAGTRNGVTCYGRITSIEVSGDIILFTTDAWHELQHTIKPVGYGIASSMLTTLQSLQHAKELPELFMKSEGEKLIWHMLRRVSDRIRVRLNHPAVEQATAIEAFQANGITAEFLQESETVTIQVHGHKWQCSVQELKRRPVRVFKELVAAIQKEAL